MLARGDPRFARNARNFPADPPFVLSAGRFADLTRGGAHKNLRLSGRIDRAATDAIVGVPGPVSDGGQRVDSEALAVSIKDTD